VRIGGTLGIVAGILSDRDTMRGSVPRRAWHARYSPSVVADDLFEPNDAATQANDKERRRKTAASRKG
jgi:hypothetical protein